jgi:hypothetical protein
MTVLVINGTRFLINEANVGIESYITTLLKFYPEDASVHFEEATYEDVKPIR